MNQKYSLPPSEACKRPMNIRQAERRVTIMGDYELKRNFTYVGTYQWQQALCRGGPSVLPLRVK